MQKALVKMLKAPVKMLKAPVKMLKAPVKMLKAPVKDANGHPMCKFGVPFTDRDLDAIMNTPSW
jgi:hypothetical protein